MKEYLERISNQILKERLSARGAVLIEGPKWCGKTTTARSITKSEILMDQPELTTQYKELADMNPIALLQGETPHLIDEWQIAPKLWNAVRFEVDRRDEFGQFILTGSAVPPELDSSTHSGIGRISRFYMRTMSLYEQGFSTGEVSLQDMFDKKIIYGKDEHTLEEIAFEICRGGWPKAARLSGKTALRQAIDYVDALIKIDINRVDGVMRDAEKANRILRSYARNIGTQANFTTIQEDVISSADETFDIKTLYSYINALKMLFVIEDSTAWNPNLRSKTAIRTSDTRYFVDPSIATAACGLGPKDLIGDLRTMGMFFENMCIRDLRIYADVLDGQIYHYRDKSGLECDAIMHLRNGDYGLIEIKLGGDRAIEEATENLLKLANKIDTDKMKKPAFLMVLCGVAPFAYTRKNGVSIVPAGCLKF